MFFFLRKTIILFFFVVFVVVVLFFRWHPELFLRVESSFLKMLIWTHKDSGWCNLCAELKRSGDCLT